VRVRIVLGVGLFLVAAALAVDISRAAPRTAGSDHTSMTTFSATVPGGGRLCQIAPRLTSEASSAQVLIGTFGRQVPRLTLSFVGAANEEVGGGYRPAGGREGLVTIPFARSSAAGKARSVCLLVGGNTSVVLAGERGKIGRPSELVNGRRQGGRISILYLRPGKQSWWELLGVLDHRFGLGKASVFGDWTLPAAGLAMLGLWMAAIRLLTHELK
jgi:hypothetical protein